ncbi:MAG: DUF542 domain-containing protein [Chitinophagaceae bacterium]|nr:DUF542 domain-containing protein [Chitinophagaceae bacterium]
MMIDRKSFVSDIVAQDYRTADVFRRHDITYCCGGKWPLDMACELRGLDADKIKTELEAATRTITIPHLIDFNNWNIDFLTNYIVEIHHNYLKTSLPLTHKMLEEFVEEHRKKFSHLDELELKFTALVKQLHSSISKEEETLFPYIRQIVHAQNAKEPYAALLVRTLRKPVEGVMSNGHNRINDLIMEIRHLTNSYNPPENVCTSHKVVIAKLKELDNDLVQHLYLEQSVLFPRVSAIEKELLGY